MQSFENAAVVGSGVSAGDVVFYIILGALGLFGLFTLLASFFTVDQQTAAVVQRFGKFLKISLAGLNFKVPWIDWIVNTVNLRVQQLDVKVETKTEDNVFVIVVVSVQYFVKPEKIYDAFYKLTNHEEQITSFVFDVVRARVPKIKLDDVFEKKDEIADVVKSELAQVMDDFGYGIVKALVTDIEPDAKVKAAMNEINAAQRERIAANEKGEADRILKVKSAEAEAQSKALQGKGIADQRKAIALGIEESLEMLKRAGVNPQEATIMMLMTQWLDTLNHVGANSRTNTILVPHSPGAVGTLMQELTKSLLVAQTAGGDWNGTDQSRS